MIGGKKSEFKSFPRPNPVLIPDCGPLVWPAGMGLLPGDDGHTQRHPVEQGGFWSRQKGWSKETVVTCILLHMLPEVSHSESVIPGIKSVNRTSGPPILTFFVHIRIIVNTHIYILDSFPIWLLVMDNNRQSYICWLHHAASSSLCNFF